MDIGSTLKNFWVKLRTPGNFTRNSFASVQSEPVTHHHTTPSWYATLGGQLGSVASFISDRGRSPYLLLSTMAFSLLLATGVALTRRPWCDEAWFASPSYNLARHGFMGMTILDPHGFIHTTYVQGIDRYTFWVMPGYLLLQAAWYKMVGVSVFSMRATSVLWSAAALVSWFFIARWIIGDRRVALLAVFLLATEKHFVFSAATGRMDMMCFSLGLISLAAYIRLRSNFTLALFVASSVSAINFFTHPNAIFGIFAVAFLALYFDRNRITIRALLLAASPFLFLGLLWGLYLAQAPHAVVVSQFNAQAKVPHRLVVPWNLWKSFWMELRSRYLHAWTLGSSFPVRLDRIVMALYGIAIITALSVSQIRRQLGTRVLLILGGITFALLMCFQKNWYYMVFIIPYFSTILAIVSAWAWRQYLNSRVVVVLLLGVFTAVQLAPLGFKIVHDDYRRHFLEATKFLKLHAKPGDLIIGSGELAFSLGFEGQVLDDCRMGFLSGKRPDYIVMDSHYRDFWLPMLLEPEPAAVNYMLDLMHNQYDVVYDQTYDGYQVYGFSDEPYQILKRRPVPLY